MLLNFISWKEKSLGVFFEGILLMVADQDGYFLIILGESYIKINITYSSVKWSDLGDLLNAQGKF